MTEKWLLRIEQASIVIFWITVLALVIITGVMLGATCSGCATNKDDGKNYYYGTQYDACVEEMKFIFFCTNSCMAEMDSEEYQWVDGENEKLAKDACSACDDETEIWLDTEPENICTIIIDVDESCEFVQFDRPGRCPEEIDFSSCLEKFNGDMDR